MSKEAKVAVVMGSDSDYDSLQSGLQVLRDFSVEFTAHVMSAHRTPERTCEFAENAEKKGYQVIICAAGLAAHLGGVIASKTILPVIGVPIETGPLKGMDALLATVQMPGGVPVATVGIGNAVNAALLAVEIIARSDAGLAEALHKYKLGMVEKVMAKNSKLQARLQE